MERNRVVPRSLPTPHGTGCIVMCNHNRLHRGGLRLPSSVPGNSARCSALERGLLGGPGDLRGSRFSDQFLGRGVVHRRAGLHGGGLSDERHAVRLPTSSRRRTERDRLESEPYRRSERPQQHKHSDRGLLHLRDRCVAVGYRSTDGDRGQEGEAQRLTEAWDGTAWTVQSTPAVQDPAGGQLAAVSCASPVVCIAVGSGSTSGGFLAEQWNGTSWSPRRRHRQWEVLITWTQYRASPRMPASSWGTRSGPPIHIGASP